MAKKKKEKKSEEELKEKKEEKKKEVRVREGKKITLYDTNENAFEFPAEREEELLTQGFRKTKNK